MSSQSRKTLEEESLLSVVRTYESLSAPFAQLFRDNGLSEPQYNVLRILRGAGDPLPVRQVAERMVTRQPDITRLVDRLEKQGFAQRVRCDSDRRVIYVALTPAGRKLVDALDGPVKSLLSRRLGHLSRGKLDQLNELLSAVRDGE